MATSSFDFNLAMTNLFIGLVRGHRYLRPYSLEIKGLGYQLVGVESRFIAQNNRVHPDAIACSRKNQHTLLTEWTGQDEPGERKKQQITGYLRVTGEDLVNVLGIEPKAASRASVWLVVRPEAATAFQNLLERGKNRLLLNTFAPDPDQGYQLGYAGGEFQDEKLAALFKQPLAFKRIPFGYIPVSLGNLQTRQFKVAVLQQLIAFLAQKRQEFTLVAICQGIFPVWDHIGQEMRRSVGKAVKEFLNRLVRKKGFREHLARINDDPPTWRIMIPEGKDPAPMYRKLKTNAEQLLAELKGESWQLALPLFEE